MILIPHPLCSRTQTFAPTSSCATIAIVMYWPIGLCFPGEDSGLVQGDIKIDDRVRQLMNRRARVKRGPTAYEDRLWPKNNIAKAVIPYSIDDSAGNVR